MTYQSKLENIKTELIEIQSANNDINTIPSIPGAFNRYTEILNKYGLLHRQWSEDQKNVEKLIHGINQLAESEMYKIWFFQNICDLGTTFAQIQTDNTIPDQGFAMYKDHNTGTVLSFGYAILREINKIQEKLCKYDGHCKRCGNSAHYNEFFHILSKKPSKHHTQRFKPYGGTSKKSRRLKKVSLNKTQKSRKTRKSKKFPKIEKLTDKFLKEITVNNDPEAVAKLFCYDGSLIGTLSRVIRRNNNIQEYFNYFAKLKGIKVLSKKYNIYRVDNTVFINIAEVKWVWDKLKNPVNTRMTFVYRDNCIFQLHSSSLPESNKNIK